MLGVIVALLVAVTIVTVATLRESLVERLFIFFPSRTLDALPSQAGLEVQEIFFSTADGLQLHAWYAPAGPSEPVLLHCHGNGGNISHRLGLMTALRRVGLGVFLFDYRGYGLSQGVASEAGIYEDARAAYRYVVEELGIPPERLVLAGHSLGGVVAARLAAQVPARALILESTFTNLGDMARRHYFWLPTRFLWAEKFNAVGGVSATAIPKLVVHGSRDTIVPYELGQKLYRLGAEPKTFHTVTGAGHNDLYEVGGQSYFRVLRSFIDQAPEKSLAKR